ncbi:MAG: MarR family winged helix-turn-helix transcriptional regulator [Hyphomicrobiaceae bacterium]
MMVHEPADTTNSPVLAVVNDGVQPGEKDRIANVVKLLRRINHVADLHSKHLVRSTGLTTPQFIVLSTIKDLGEVTAGRVANEASLSQGTVSIILDRLENHGLIERYRSKRDRRIVHAKLTEKGDQALAKAPSLLREAFIAKFRTLSLNDQRQIVMALESVAGMMDPPEPVEVAS